MKNEIEVLNNIIETHNQYLQKSELWKTIYEVFYDLKREISIDESQLRAREYCNVMSFYALCRANNIVTVSLYDFIKKGIEKKWIGTTLTTKEKEGDNGFIKIGKDYLLSKYDVKFELVYFDTMYNLDQGFYQMKIKSRAGGYHFMACYFYRGVLYLSDTSNRGINVVADEKVSQKEFQWLLRIA